MFSGGGGGGGGWIVVIGSYGCIWWFVEGFVIGVDIVLDDMEYGGWVVLGVVVCGGGVVLEDVVVFGVDDVFGGK